MKKILIAVSASPFLSLFLSLFLFNAALANSLNETPDFNQENWLGSMIISHEKGANKAENKVTSKATQARIFQVDAQLLTQQLLDNKSPLIAVPLPNGQFVNFRLTANTVMPATLAAKYPNIRSFDGMQINNATHQGKFDITPQGFHGVFFYRGKKVFVDPVYRGNKQLYHSYFRADAQPLITASLYKKQQPRQLFKQAINRLKNTNTSVINNPEINTYRLAISATGEYTAFQGGTKNLALAAIVTMVNRLNEVYQQDVSIKFQLVAQNDALIFIDASTDPFDNTDNDIDANANVINNAIGETNYDIGHVVGTGAGGLAGLGVVCSSFKAQGVTGSSVPTNDAFYIDFVAHEIGHQFNANHTFNGTTDSCSGNRSGSSAYEVGGASTIMGYAGICGEENLQFNSDAYFHIHSIDQIDSFIQGKPSCGVHVAKTNQAPNVDAGSDFSIPARTAFTLIGSASDTENDNLTYSWEEFDLGTASASKIEAQTDDGSRPLFRNFIPKNNAARTFPQLSDLINNKVTFGETLPTTTRDLNFRLVVRDDQNNINDDAIKVSVLASDTGFNIIEPSANASWNSDQQTVTWYTAQTELAPINCSQVDIWLSNDSGNSFAWLLLEKTNNDGSEQVNLPALNTDKGRIKVSCSRGGFFAFSTSDINIVSNGSNFDSKPEFIAQNNLALDEDQNITLSSANFTFINNLVVDSLIVGAGSNYQVIDNNITPTANFNGELTVPVTATKGQYTSDVFMASVIVNAVNDLPIAEDDSVQVEQDSSNNIFDVLNNDSDIDNDILSLSAIDYSGAGSVSISDNKVSYSPVLGFSGNDSFSYTIDDGAQGTSNATVTIVVNAKAIVDNGNSKASNSSSSGGSVSLLLGAWWLVFMRRLLKLPLASSKSLIAILLLFNLTACEYSPQDQSSVVKQEQATEVNQVSDIKQPSIKKQSIKKQPIPAPVLQQYSDDESLAIIMQLRVEKSLTQAKQNNDKRLFATKGRRLVIPGVEPQFFMQVKQQCGIQFIKNSGDVLKNQQDNARRKADYLFAVNYNKSMLASCLKK
ncbi:MAG: cadherin-like domain-containing protein [Alteromonadaceae bacterium]|nr:cadherin-like domain-containing protein [Alteromonadaceae bacterium]